MWALQPEHVYTTACVLCRQLQELPGPRLSHGDIAMRMQQMLQEQGITDIQRYKLPLFEKRLSSLPADAANQVRLPAVVDLTGMVVVCAHVPGLDLQWSRTTPPAGLCRRSASLQSASCRACSTLPPG